MPVRVDRPLAQHRIVRASFGWTTRRQRLGAGTGSWGATDPLGRAGTGAAWVVGESGERVPGGADSTGRGVGSTGASIACPVARPPGVRPATDRLWQIQLKAFEVFGQTTAPSISRRRRPEFPKLQHAIAPAASPLSAVLPPPHRFPASEA